ncbi:ABC transporter ATP-binding protein [Candidatus Bathyarchaeota archaeon]|nr:MAG: ABC transporter ATP-binding protein [Candidatus Bathyarchaeota archaeon]RLG99122.1 MAG: ABC transporter ATP-binding protein [Candidatus Bathyarchaeota archaeon]
MRKILEVQDLLLRFYTYEGVVKALEGVNLHMIEGETLGVVGETGCGKTMTGLSILSLTPSPGRIEGGRIFFQSDEGWVDILSLDEETVRRIRGREISMIFQEPNAALNPLLTVEEQISEVLIQHRREEFIKKVLNAIEEDLQKTERKALSRAFIYKIEKKIYENMLKNPKSLLVRVFSKTPILRRYQNRLRKEVRREVVRILKEIKIPDPERVVDMYPHELSGGMQQRVVIAMALACNPKLLISDEPTTNLDVTVEAQILNLIKELKSKFGSSILYITHDMGVVAEICDRVAVMYAGSVCEIADVFEIFRNPLHPYTKALLESIPRPGKKFKSIEGTVPNLVNPPPGCRFHPRCPKAMPICAKVKPDMVNIDGHFVACHLYRKGRK